MIHLAGFRQMVDSKLDVTLVDSKIGIRHCQPKFKYFQSAKCINKNMLLAFKSLFLFDFLVHEEFIVFNAEIM